MTRSNVPNETQGFVLNAIHNEGSIHPWGVRKIVSEKTGVKIPVPTLYGIFRYLRKNGLVNTQKKDQKVLYSLTDNGRQALMRYLDRTYRTHPWLAQTACRFQ